MKSWGEKYKLRKIFSDCVVIMKKVFTFAAKIGNGKDVSVLGLAFFLQ